MAGDMNVRNIRADDLRYLVAVANTGRLVAAAHALGVDHTTVSRRLRTLEKVLGVTLLERGAYGWELTETGRAVAEQARPIQAAVEGAALAAAGAHPDALAGTVRVTAPDGFGTLFAVPALTRVRQRHPDLSIELITATRQLGLHQSGFDLAIAIGEPTTTRLFTERLAEYALALYASADYLAEHGDLASADEVARHTLIYYIDPLLQVGDLDLDRYLPGATARFTSTNIFAQLEATRRGAGIGLLPKFLAVTAPELTPVAVGLPPLRLAITLAARKDSVTRPAVQAVRQALHEEVRTRRAELL
jgi:DNA-binding transcriptional LysR family regulator